jgi:TPR repeat protein
VHEDWRLKVAQLNLAERYEESAAILRAKIRAGDLSAHAMLARIGRSIGIPGKEVNRLIDYVESNMESIDVDSHVELHRAYDQRLGSLPYEQIARRSFDHLLAAAELGAGAIYSLAVARIYRIGAMTVRSNLIESERWYKKAIEQGSVEAMHEIQMLQSGCSQKGRNPINRKRNLD